MSFDTASPMLDLSPPPFQHSIPKSHSKSEQLARAVAEAQASPQKPYRPDSSWSEGGADVIWHGNGATGTPPLPSPAAHSTHTVFSLNTTDSEFADAHEGSRSEEEDESNWDGANTTMTTVSTSDSRKGSAAYSPLHSTPILSKTAPPARPKKRVPARLLEQVSSLQSNGAGGPVSPSLRGEDEDDLDPAASSDGLSRASSIGSSIWAGRGGRKVEDAPPMPDANSNNRNNALLQENSAFNNNARSRQSGASSVYSQGQSPAMEWEDSPKIDQGEDKENRKIKGTLDEDGKRRLADGTIIPKMPPMPSSANQDGHFEVPLPRSRSKKGRQNRSPVMSYADGAEEEERLEQERDLASRGMEVTSSMGPKLKKNSPAPWEMPDEQGDGERQSSELWEASSRQSGDQLLPPTAKYAWARQSVESLRNRSASSGVHAQQNLQSSTRTSQGRSTSPLPPLSDEPASDPATDAAIANTRRSRAKSVSSGAAGMLKGLGLSSAANGAAPTNKKSSKFGKALRGISTGNRSSSSSSMEGRKYQGISSEDYAHLPPSPLPDSRFELHDSDKGDVHPSASKSTLTLDRQKGQRGTIPPPINTARLSSSNDSHTGTVTSNATSSHYTALTSPGFTTDKQVDLPDLMIASGGKHREQSILPSPKKMTAGLSVPPASSTASSASSHRNAYSSDRATSSSPSRGSERSDVMTPTKPKTLSPSKSSPALRAKSASRSQSMVPSSSNQGISQGISTQPGFENTPYKLISLEEARRQQKPIKPSYSSEQRIPSSSSNRSLTGEGKDEMPQRQLKNKKSGFLRRFAKDKNELQSDEADLPALLGDTNEDAVPEMKSFSGPSLAAPALSLRPMSSMFNGFAPGMLENIEQNEANKQRNQISTFSGNEQLSPGFTFSSHEGNNSSRASSQAVFEDAIDRSPQSDYRSPPLPSKAVFASHSSMESLHSVASSAQPVVSGTSPAIGTVDVAKLANATRKRAMEIEARIADLLGDLVKLRTLNVEYGAVDDNEALASSPLLSTVAACANCGCDCADQKRIQVVNQMAAIKAAQLSKIHSTSSSYTAALTTTTTTSVLSRGRVVKPKATADAGKFGSYTNR